MSDVGRAELAVLAAVYVCSSPRSRGSSRASHFVIASTAIVIVVGRPSWRGR